MALLWSLLIGVYLLAQTTSLPVEGKQLDLSTEKVNLLADLLTPLLQERSAAMGPLEMINPADLLFNPMIGNRKKRRTSYDRYTKHVVEIAPLRRKKNKDGKTPLAIILAASDLVEKNNKRKKVNNSNINKQKVIKHQGDNNFETKKNIVKKKQDKEFKFVLDLGSVNRDKEEKKSESDSEDSDGDISGAPLESDHLGDINWAETIQSVNSKETNNKSSESKENDTKDKLIKGIKSWIGENSIPVTKNTILINTDSNESKKLKKNDKKVATEVAKTKETHEIITKNENLDTKNNLQRKEVEILKEKSEQEKDSIHEEITEVENKEIIHQKHKESKQDKGKSDEGNSKQFKINDNEINSENTLENSRNKIIESIENIKKQIWKETSGSVEQKNEDTKKRNEHTESKEKEQIIVRKETKISKGPFYVESKETNTSIKINEEDASKEQEIEIINDVSKSQSISAISDIFNELNDDNIIYTPLKTISNEISLLKSHESNAEDSNSNEAVTIRPINKVPRNLSDEIRKTSISKEHEGSVKKDWLENLEQGQLFVPQLNYIKDNEFHSVEQQIPPIKEVGENLSNESKLDIHSYYAIDNLAIDTPESIGNSVDLLKDVRYDDHNIIDEISDERPQEIHFRSSKMMRNSVNPQVIATENLLSNEIEEKLKHIILNDTLTSSISEEVKLMDIHKKDQWNNDSSSECNSESSSDSLKGLENLIGKDNIILLNDLRKHTKDLEELPLKGLRSQKEDDEILGDVTNEKVIQKSNEIELISINELKNNDVIGVIDSLFEDLDHTDTENHENKINSRRSKDNRPLLSYRKREKSPKLKTYNLSFLFTK